MSQLASSWAGDGDDSAIETVSGEIGGGPAVPATPPTQTRPATPDNPSAGPWRRVAGSLEITVQTALPSEDARSRELADRMAGLTRRIDAEGVDAPLAAEVDSACQEARRLLVQRHQLVDQLAALARELTAGLTELAEDDSWARGQAQAMHARLGPAEGSTAPSVRSVRAAQDCWRRRGASSSA